MRSSGRLPAGPWTCLIGMQTLGFVTLHFTEGGKGTDDGDLGA